MKRIASRLFIVLSAVLYMGAAYGVIDSYEFSTAEQEHRFFDLTNELRCPKCQNQSIADSNAPISQDLRREVHRLLNEGADNQTVIDFMLARYGDFVLYKPRLSGVNLVLWLGPVLLLLIGVGVLVGVVRKHKTALVECTDVISDEQQAFEARQLDQKLNRILAGSLTEQLSDDNKANSRE